jgi:serine acetyltransferase
MSDAGVKRAHLTSGALWRVVYTVTWIVVVESLVCALALFPVTLLWTWIVTWPGPPIARAFVLSCAIVPSYALFALGLMLCSAIAMRLTATRTAPNLELPIAELSWPLLIWVRYMVSSHLVRVFAGTLFRGSPVWTAYLRLNGARLGARVYVNTLFISDHNLLRFGNEVVIGSEVHISGHTIEGGVLKTGTVHLGDRVTIGLASVVEIGVEAGPDCQVGAFSLVPKHITLDGGATYAGIPVRRLR